MWSDLKPLKLVHPGTLPGRQAKAGVSVAFALDQARASLTARFEVRGIEQNVNAGLPADSPQWGLWDWDVVEVFVRASASPTYYEFQVSPLGQYFELEIFEPRKRVNRDYRSGFTHSATRVSATDWNAELTIPLKSLGWDGRPESVRGNAFAILSKTYWSLTLPPQQKPDFHLPEYFTGLLEL